MPKLFGRFSLTVKKTRTQIKSNDNHKKQEIKAHKRVSEETDDATHFKRRNYRQTSKLAKSIKCHFSHWPLALSHAMLLLFMIKFAVHIFPCQPSISYLLFVNCKRLKCSKKNCYCLMKYL